MSIESPTSYHTRELSECIFNFVLPVSIELANRHQLFEYYVLITFVMKSCEITEKELELVVINLTSDD